MNVIKIFIEDNLRRIKIKKRILAVMILVSFVPMLIIGGLTYTETQAIIVNKVSDYCIQISKDLNMNASYLMKQLDTDMSDMIYNHEIQAKFKGYNDSTMDSIAIKREIEEMFLSSKLQYFNEGIAVELHLFSEADEIVCYGYRKDLKLYENTTRLYRALDDYRLKPTYTSYANRIDEINTVYEPLNKSEGIFLVSRPIVLLNKAKRIGVLHVLMKGTYFEPIYDEILYGGDVYIVSNTNEVIFSSDENFIGEQFQYEMRPTSGRFNDNMLEYHAGDTKMLAVQEVNEINGWSVIYSVPYSQLTNEVNRFGIFIMLVAILLLFISSLLTYAVFISIIHPVVRLNKAAISIESGDYSVTVPAKGNDEMSVVSQSFNRMAKQIRDLIEKIYMVQLSQKDAELKALQAQINPHFLFNTLESIRWEAKSANVNRIAKRISMLANMFKVVLEEDNITTMEKEVDHARYYLYIQQYYYEERLRVIWDVNTALLGTEVMKFILQPIVENSIIHGFQGVDTLTVTISIYEQDRNLMMEIRDDGCGTDEEAIRRILHEKDDRKNSIGLSNVYNRLMLYYSEQCSFRFNSEPGSGTVVTIGIPKSEEGDVLDNKNDCGG